jgi:DNA polymerase-3 subunit delta'
MPFRHVIGHRRVLGLLSRAAARGTLPPSLIFAGPAGVGKHTTAIALAQALNCANPPRDVILHDTDGDVVLPLDACGECPSCRRIARGTHPDIIVIAPDEDSPNIRIDRVRDVNERVAYRPFEARVRMVVIDEADALVPPAQNALLKTLEEPPSSSMFVLVTDSPDRLLETVRSRCPRVRFAPLSPADIAAWLQRERSVAAQDAEAVAAVADGSLARALDASSETVSAMRRAAQRLLEQTARPRDARARLAAAQQIVGKTAKGFGAGERESLAMHLRLVHALLRDVGALGAAPDASLLANADMRPALEALVPAYDPRRLTAAFATVRGGLDALDRNASPKVVADWVAMHL